MNLAGLIQMGESDILEFKKNFDRRLLRRVLLTLRGVSVGNWGNGMN
jgi:hypothetical protein